MTTTRSRLAVLLCFLVATHVAAAPPKFSSVYTDLAKDCRDDDAADTDADMDADADVEADANADSNGEREDVPLICKGYGPYRGFIFFSAIDNVFVVQSARPPHEEQSDQILLKDYDKGTIEWRLADGEPFAVIVRTPAVDHDDVKQSAGLIVQGLGKYSSLQARIPTTKNPRANQQARDAADSGYMSGK